MRRFAILCALLAARPALADEPQPPEQPASEDPEGHLAKAREFHDHGEFDKAREELLAAYKLAPKPELLFALGQIEFNLHHYKQAIDYYEKFLATTPSSEQQALAEQALGAARTELARPKPLPPKPPPHREWDFYDSGLVVVGGLALGASAGLVIYSRHLVDDRSGKLSDYDHRVSHAQNLRWTGVGCAAAGALAIGAAVLRYRLHFVETTLEVSPAPGGATVTLEHPL